MTIGEARMLELDELRRRADEFDQRADDDEQTGNSHIEHAVSCRARAQVLREAILVIATGTKR